MGKKNKRNNAVKEKDKVGKLLGGITAVCFVAVVLVVGRFLIADSSSLGFSNNTIINGVNISGMDAYQAEKALGSAFKKKAETFELVLTYKDAEWKFTKDNFTVNSNIHTILEEAQIREQINNDYQKQLNTINKITQSGKDINVAFNYIFVGLEEKIDEIIKTINIKPINSNLTFNPHQKNNFTITKHKDGLKVNKEQLYYDINEQFLKTNKVKVEIPTLIDEAETTYEYNTALTSKLSQYTSNVSDSTGNRKSNVKLALSKINGLIVEPQQTVSFNKLTGPHSQSNGYKVAKIIFNGQFVDGVGGGICQASTTLYNALIRADVQINKVSKHTLPVKYVPMGLDAMVAEGIADLEFTNPFCYPIFIKATTTSEDVKVEVYGHLPEHGMTIKARSEIIRKIPHGGDIIKKDVNQQYSNKVLYEGEKYRLTYPREGYEAKAYLDYFKNDKLITTKVIRHETYYPQQGVVIEGTQIKPVEFNEIENQVESIKPQNETSNTFMFNLTNQNDIETVPTNFCP